MAGGHQDPPAPPIRMTGLDPKQIKIRFICGLVQYVCPWTGYVRELEYTDPAS